MKLEELYNEIAVVLAEKRQDVKKYDDEIDRLQFEILGLKEARAQRQIEFESLLAMHIREYDSVQERIRELLALSKLKVNAKQSQDDMEVYREAVQKVCSEEPALELPAFALAKQVQLCRHVHYLTMYKNTQHLLRTQTAQSVRSLEVTLRQQTDDIAKVQVGLLSEIALKQSEMESLRTELTNYTMRFEARTSRLRNECKKEEQLQSQNVENSIVISGHDEISTEPHIPKEKSSTDDQSTASLTTISSGNPDHHLSESDDDESSYCSDDGETEDDDDEDDDDEDDDEDDCSIEHFHKSHNAGDLAKRGLKTQDSYVTSPRREKLWSSLKDVKQNIMRLSLTRSPRKSLSSTNSRSSGNIPSVQFH